MRTIFTAEDVKNIIETIFNGNLRQFLISKLSLLNHIAECAKARSIDIERSDL